MKVEYLITLILSTAVSAYPIAYNREGQLQILNAQPPVLEAIFFTTETGIRLYSDNSSLILTSMSDDEVLLPGRVASDSSKLYNMMGTNFLQHTTTDENGQPTKHNFVVPESEVGQIKDDIEARKEQRVTSRLRAGSETEVKTAEELAFQRLFSRPEIGLIEPAAKALGRVGVMGYENKGALVFYGTAMVLIQAQTRNGENGSGSGGDGGEADSVEHSMQDKRQIVFPTLNPDPLLPRPQGICWTHNPLIWLPRQCTSWYTWTNCPTHIIPRQPWKTNTSTWIQVLSM